MRERNPFQDLLENLDEDDWNSIEEELLNDDGGPGGPGRGGGGFGGGGDDTPQGNPRMLLWIVVPFLAISLFNWGLGFFTDWIWYESLELSSVFLTRIVASVSLFLAGAVIFWLIVAVNVLLARRLEPAGLADTPVSQIAEAIGVRITPIILLGAAVFAFFMGSAAGGTWEQVLLYFNQSAFNITDPVFDNDVGFYIFTLPIWQFARNWLMTTLVLTLIATAVVSGIGWRGWDSKASVRAHLSGLGALILLLIAWQYRLDALGLVYSTRGAVFGAGYTDVNAQLPAYNLLVIVTLITAVLLLVNVFLRQAWRAIVVVLVVWVAISALAGNVYPGLVQRFQVSPNEYNLEEPFIQNNIEFTRIAFELTDIEVEDYEVATEIESEALVETPETIANIRLWDYRPLLQTYNQIQALRQYYTFSDIDVDRYEIDGNVRQVMLSARELVPEQLAEEAQTWVNRKLVYTHGYGVAVSPVAEITRDGLPEFLLKDLPPQGVLTITQPQIYFGEGQADYVVVRTNTPEFDYPQDTGNVFTRFEADTGIPIASYLNRLAFSLRFADVNIVLADAIEADSRLLWRRNIHERVREVAPFLLFDEDPYIVLSDDGKLYWIHDAYTASNRFPYSTQPDISNPLLPRWRLNYIRNSVKIVTDAYSGEMTFYVVDSGEPILAAYAQIFPDLFTPMTEMPADLVRHIRYPNDLFSIQAEVFRTYHMIDSAEFYNREDLWAWPEESFDNSSVLMEPYYVLMQLPGREGLDYVQILPFTPANRENMISWLAANSDPDRYGEKIVYVFGKDTLFYGPKQIEARINQDPVISSQLSLWNQQGSQVIRGNLLVIPVGGGLLYVEPLYLQAEDGKIPELKRVILATADQVVMAENFGLALAEIFGRDILEEALLAELVGDTALPPTSGGSEITLGTEESQSDDINELIFDANIRYSQAQEALRQGDWATYGNEMSLLQQLLERMAEVSGVMPAAAEEPDSPLPEEGEELPDVEGEAEGEEALEEGDNEEEPAETESGS